MVVAGVLIILTLAYVLTGVVVAVAVHARGLGDIDPVARGAGWGFRMVITPGLVALWPWVVGTWRRRAGMRDATESDA